MDKRVDRGKKEGAWFLSDDIDSGKQRTDFGWKERYQQPKLRHNERELLDLRMANAHLVERLEHLSRQAASHAQSLNSSSSPEVSGHIGNNSLLDEIGHQGSPFSSDRKRRTMSPDEVLDDIEEDIECEDSDGHIRLGFTSSEIKELKQEILDVYHMCRAMIDQIRHQRRNSLSSLETLSSDEVDVSQVKVGLLREVMKELKSLFHDLIRRENQLSLSSASSSESPSQVALELEVQLHRSKEACEQLERQFEKLSKERDAQQKENDSLQGQLTVTEARLAACEEQRDTYKQDLENTHLSKDVLVKKAWEVRDKAVQRKNTAEIELARTRVEVMQINSQLMEAVQQKVELKIKLDQWEADMERLLEEKVKKKLVSSSSKTNYRPSKNQNSSGGESDSSPPRKRTSRFMSYFTRQSPSS
ncbi:unnamed protein product [Cyprideis torosa]|uniref:Uncharacterized protein n=1 Tax=Cyprideis torosa TaxID=163714 RepID=A0A7R8WAD7_9CRUS|nr:unnamed protein product [Cyprideis torosa]CAG0890918.1 unnamed protein product [Cyprideis torosa]